MTAAAPAPIVPTLAGDLPHPLRLGLVRAEPIAVTPSGEPIEAEIAATCRDVTTRLAGLEPAATPGLQSARDLYRRFGIDPTRTRPSSEALLRRILQGKPFPRILNAVDLCNLCAVRFLLPIGLYDTGRIRGAVTLRPGRQGESYAGIRKEEVHLAGRPVLADEEGPFGNPTSDSLRTSVTVATRSLWMVIFAPIEVSGAEMEAHVAHASDLCRRFLAPAGGVVAAGGSVMP